MKRIETYMLFSKAIGAGFFRGLMAGLLSVHLFCAPASAVEMASGSKRITRSSVNQGGSGSSPMSSDGYRVRGTAGENSTGTMSSSSKKVSDGLVKIYYYPGTITTITPTPGTSSGEINLSWSAPGADGALRTSSAYVIKFSTHPNAITSQNYFEHTATTFKLETNTHSPGTTETFTLTGLQPGTSYYVAIEARDADKNQGYLSNSTYTWAQISLLSVSIENENGDPDMYGFGTIDMSSAVVSTATIRVTNTGTTAATWSLRAATITADSPWQLTTGSLGTDLFRLSAGFDEVKPSSTTFGSEDRLIPTDAASSVTKFSIDSSTTGVNVGINNSRLIWFLIETPLATSTTDQQSIQVTVTANAP
ncbi:MAG TPA: fibronectin type III domain-containing protein [Elusimicrobiota bacterium]|nr:fibronectin type III domain-containing protein [Elusimicrobiota bacterium]